MICLPLQTAAIVDRILKGTEHKQQLTQQLFNALPDGWCAREAADLLYQLAFRLDGPFLEIGSFVGRSTAAICYGIQHSGKRKSFYTVDLHAEDEKEHHAHYGQIYENPQVLEKMQWYMNREGTLARLNSNLEELGLTEHATILRGDFAAVAPKIKYSLIHCDVTHDAAEIDAVAPKLLQFMDAQTVLVCDDINDERMFDYLLRYIPAKYATRVECSIRTDCAGGHQFIGILGL